MFVLTWLIGSSRRIQCYYELRLLLNLQGSKKSYYVSDLYVCIVFFFFICMVVLCNWLLT
jgi:hypothetical protein